MGRGSQLAQLKSALSSAGLSGQSRTKKRKKTHITSRERDRDKSAKKLREIHERLNPFDVKVTKLKHDIGGRKLKGVTGRPGMSKQVGIEQRKKTLLVEYEQKDHAGGIVDRRFGENDPSMPPEARMLERFTRERQRASKGNVFNLEDEDNLTHYGHSLSALDDFDGVGLNVEEDEDNGQIDGKTVKEGHFGGFEDDEESVSDDDGRTRKKSKAEVMAEVIAKSKEHKYQRQMEKEEDERTRHDLDQEFDSIRGLLMNDLDSTGAWSNSLELPPVGTTQPGDTADHEYDQFVRELAFDKRSKPKNRTKTEEELALEEKEALEKAEKDRVRRMMGIEDGSDSDASGGIKSRKWKKKRERGADDLDDDFLEEGELNVLGPGLGFDVEKGMNEHDDAASGSDESLDDEDSIGDRNVDSDDPEEQADGDGDALPLVSSERHLTKGKQLSKGDELPFTFPCPKTHEEFLSIVEDIEDADVPTVVQRIRSLNHPSLSMDNPAKLQTFTTVLVDYILHITSPPAPRFSLAGRLLLHLYDLSRAYPVVSAQAFVSKLVLMHGNLTRGVSDGVTSTDSKTWPGPAELGFLRVIGVIWSTSDFNHAVVSPARVLMGEYLGLCRIRSIADVASGLFLSTIFLQFEESSKRLVPEAINFLLNVILHLAPDSFKNMYSLPGSFPSPDFGSEAFPMLKIDDRNVAFMEVLRPDLILILLGKNSPQIKLGLLNTAFKLLMKYADMYKGLDGFLELCSPILKIIENLELDRFPVALQTRASTLTGTLSKLIKFSKQSRRSLVLQAHKPIPIPSYVPKFSVTSSNYLRHQDPDVERAAASKLRHQVKHERKGAIRELRKDSRFLAGVQQKRQAEEDKRYGDRMKRVFGSIEGERAEQKALDREKAREKRRAGRK